MKFVVKYSEYKTGRAFWVNPDNVCSVYVGEFRDGPTVERATVVHMASGVEWKTPEPPDSVVTEINAAA